MGLSLGFVTIRVYLEKNNSFCFSKGIFFLFVQLKLAYYIITHFAKRHNEDDIFYNKTDNIGISHAGRSIFLMQPLILFFWINEITLKCFAYLAKC